jgi:hypothetical protein
VASRYASHGESDLFFAGADAGLAVSEQVRTVTTHAANVATSYKPVALEHRAVVRDLKDHVLSSVGPGSPGQTTLHRARTSVTVGCPVSPIGHVSSP